MSQPNFPWMKPLTPWQKFRRDPTIFVVRWLNKHRPQLRSRAITGSPLRSRPITIVCVSDTHCKRPRVPDGDVLLHAGDLTNKGQFIELQEQLDWIQNLPHKYKVVIAGNHDSLLDPEFVDNFPQKIYEREGASRSDLRWGEIIYLNNSSTTLRFSGDRQLKVYGSPLTPQCGTFAFQYPPIRDTWTNTVPDDTDILLTHGPPKGHLDLDGLGCEFLLKEIRRVRPRLVVFGHIHAGHGQQHLTYSVVEAMYDGVMTKERGFGAAFVMAFCVAVEWIQATLLSFRRWQRSPKTTLVNAAVMAGAKQNTLPATIIEI